MTHGPRTDCDQCQDCPACWDLDDDGNPVYAEGVHTVELGPGVISHACNRCDGAGVWCPNFQPTDCDDCQSSTCQCEPEDV